MLFQQDPINIWMYKIYQRIGIGEMLIEQIGFHGLEINIFLNIVEVVGLMELLVL